MILPMIVCHCKRVSDREIHRAVASGASDLESVSRACGASAGCGGCRAAVVELLESLSGSISAADAAGATLATDDASCHLSLDIRV